MEGAQDTMADLEAPHALDRAGLGRVVRQTRELGVELPSKDGAVESDSPLTVEDGNLCEADCRLAGDNSGVDIGNLITVCYLWGLGWKRHMWTDAGGLELGWKIGHVVNASLWRMGG